MLVDLYLVTPPGIEALGLDRLLEACVEAGLDGACLVGTEECPPMEMAARSRFASRLFLAYGVEIPLQRGRLIWLPEDPTTLLDPGWRVGLEGGIEAARALRETRGGILVASHPYDRSGGPPFVDGVLTLRFLDGLMAGSGASDHTRDLMACAAAQRLGIPTLGGTGPGFGPEGVGASATAFVESLTSQQALVQAVQARDAWAVELISRPEQLQGKGEDGTRTQREAPAGGSRPRQDPRERHSPPWGRGPGDARRHGSAGVPPPRGTSQGHRPPRNPGRPGSDRGGR